MKRQKIWWRVSHLVIFLYLIFVLWGQYSLLDSIFPTLPIGIGIVVLAAILTHVLLKWCAKWRLALDDEAPSKKEVIKLATVVFSVSFAVLMVFYYAQFPGVFFGDAVSSLNSYLTGEYNDWHPVLYTILAFAVPMKIGGLWLIELAQIFWYCVVLTYMLCSLRYYRCPRKICIFILVYLLVMPDTVCILLFPMKDCAFAIMTMLLFTELLHIVKTKGQWLEKKYNMVFVVANLVITTIIRHNGILFTLPMLVAVVYFSRVNIRRCIALVVAVVLLFVTIKVPFYRALNVSKAEHRSAEVLGLCIGMMANAMLDAPEFMGEEAVDFLYTIQDADAWKFKYKLGDWNPVKTIDLDRSFAAIDDVSVSDILGYTLDTVIRCLDQCLRSALAVTGMVWQLDGERHWAGVYQTYVTNKVSTAFENIKLPAEFALQEYDVDIPGSEYILDVYDQYADIIENSFLQYVFCYVGLLNLILLLVLFSRREAIGKAFLFTLPVLIYSYGTMLLLTGYDIRFFYYTYACFFVIMFLVLGRDKATPEPVNF